MLVFWGRVVGWREYLHLSLGRLGAIFVLNFCRFLSAKFARVTWWQASEQLLNMLDCLFGVPIPHDFIGLLRGGVPRGGGSLMFPKVPQSSLGIFRVPQLPPPLEHPPLRNPTMIR